MINAIKVKNLRKTYGEVVAVDGISFAVKKGEIFAFLGPNGAGKSTTIKILTTILRPSSGIVRLNGFDPLKEQDKARKSFGIVFQEPSLDDELTAYENLDFHGVLYGVEKDLRKRRIRELLELVGLWERKYKLVKTFSGGMKRRLEIARGLLHHPQIFFLDEPTLGLDPQTRYQLWSHVQKLNREEGVTVFFTTHYMEEAEKIADTIAIIDKGKIVSQGSLAELKKQTHAKNLEEAYLRLTGTTIREEGPEKFKPPHMRFGGRR